MGLNPGTRLGPYEIVSPLGQGGMGEVYRAHDTRLGRDVALKVLPREVAADADRLERFRREARVLAALEHPNVVTVHSVEHADGLHFLTMQLVTGRNLAEIRGHDALPLPTLLDIAVQITSALQAAHDRGIVHRDLKPANVMVADDGRVKVLDFGLAKQAEVEADSGDGTTVLRTDPGVVMGTPAYMSPEQVLGHRLDHRSDIFSLGTLLHELATGQLPFPPGNRALLASAILRDEPPPVTETDARLPGALSEIVSRCLKKDPADRFQTAQDVGDALQHVQPRPQAAPPGARPTRTIVVLPFANRSGDPDNEYFSDGLTEEVIADLSGVGALRTISRNSSMTLKGTTKDTATLARELGVTHLVTGSVRRAGQALRVTVELVDASTDAPVWSEKYSGTLEDVFGIQEEIARKIVSALEVTFTDSESREVADRPIADTVAYDCYLRARQEMYGWTPDAALRAHRLVDEALSIVGDVPLLLATKGLLHWNDVNMNRVSAEDGLARAADYAARAHALDQTLPLAIYVRGVVAGLRGQPELALPDLYRAQALAPNDANILAEVCRFSNVAGLRHHGPLVDRLGEIDPLTPLTPLVFSSYHWLGGRPDQAATFARRAVDRTPTPSMLHVVAAWQIESAGCRTEAADLLRHTGEALGGSVLGSWASFLEHALAGDEPAALAQEAGLRDTLRNEFAAVMMAEACSLLGRHDDARHWVRTATRFGFVNHPFLSEHSRHLAALRADPEFQGLLRNVEQRWQGVTAWERARVDEHGPSHH